MPLLPWRFDGGLQAPRIGSGPVGRVDGLGVPRRVLVHVRRAVPDPLPPDVHGHPDVELDLAHLERGRVRVAEEVTDESPVFVHALRALAVRDPRGLDDGGVVAHVVHEADEPIVEHLERLAQDGVGGRDGRPRDWLGVWWLVAHGASPPRAGGCGRRPRTLRD